MILATLVIPMHGIPTRAAVTSCLAITGGLFDAPSVDYKMPGLNGEYVVVRNVCGSNVRTAGWQLTDFGHSNTFWFPASRIAGGASVTIRTGFGRDTNQVLYWGRTSGAVWNDTSTERADLIDPAGRTVSSWAPKSAAIPTAACGQSLNYLVRTAAPGATVVVPACIYRESVTITKPIRLIARPGAEIRGSDIWTGWTASGAFWVKGPLPVFDANGQCRAGTVRCRWPEQVFQDGQALRRVADSPGTGEFAVNAQRGVILGEDPAGHIMEVTTRTFWVYVAAPDVRISGFTMRHAATDAQHGAIEAAQTVVGMVVVGNVLSSAHGALVSLQGGGQNSIIGNSLSSAGQLGIHLGGVRGTGTVVTDNVIFNNNTDGFNPGWEAGGLKASGQTGLTIARNEVWGNGGPGIWCDIDCHGTRITGNRVHNNEQTGISYEISDTARIDGNWVWLNGEGSAAWVGGAGILCNVCADTEISGNVVAWNADGIGIQSQSRGATWATRGITVDNNAIFSTDRPGDSQAYALGWVQDYAGPLLDPSAANSGHNNRYWFPTPERGHVRFEWSTPRTSLAAFRSTPGGQNDGYLSSAEGNLILRESGIPLQPGTP